MRNWLAFLFVSASLGLGIWIKITMQERERIKIQTQGDLGKVVVPMPKAISEWQESEGIRYQIVRAGLGTIPSRGDRVAIRYQGFLESGEEFDSNYGQSQPFEFILGHGQVIAGMDRLIRMMPVGSKWKTDIPSDLGYGQTGIEGIIPPNTSLKFEVELISAKSSGIPQKIPDTAGRTELKFKEFSCWLLEPASGRAKGKAPVFGDTVSVHFVGWHPDGTIFDSSLGRGIPFHFRVGGKVIPGFNLLMPQLRQSEKALCIFPPKLGYQDATLPGIPPDSTLIFQVELLEILKSS